MALATLSIDLIAKIAKFEEDMGKAARAAEAQANRIERVFTGVKKAVAGLGIAAVITDQLNSVKTAIDKLDALDDLGEKYGIAASKLSGYSYASEVAGTSTEAFATGLSKLSKNMAAAAGGSIVQATAFKTVGVAVKEANGNLRSADDVLLDLATRFSSYEDGAAKAALAQAIFGKSGADLIPILNKGRDGIKELTDEARRFGLVVDDKAAKAAGDFNDNLKRLELAGQALKIMVASELLPTFVRFTNELIEGRKAFGGWLSALYQIGVKSSGFDSYADGAKKAAADVAALETQLRKLQSVDPTKPVENAGGAAFIGPRQRGGAGARAALDDQLADAQKRLAYFTKLRDMQERTEKEAIYGPSGGPRNAAPIIDSKAQSQADAAARKLEAIAHAYAKLIEGVEARGALVQSELDNNAKLGDSDKFRIEQLAKLNSAESQFSEAQRKAGAAKVDRVAKLIQEVEARNQLRAAAEADAAAEQASITLVEAGIEARIAENRGLQDQIALYGKTAEQIERASIARLQDSLAVEQGEFAARKASGAGAGELELLRNKIRLLERQIGLRSTLADINERESRDPSAGLSRGLQDYLDTVERAGEATRAATGRAVSTLEDNLTTSLVKRKIDVRSFVDTAIAEFTRLQVVRPLLKSIFGGEGADGGWLAALKAVGSFFGGGNVGGGGGLAYVQGGAYANGGLFDRAGAKPFAAGAVFGSPRFFRYANGGVMNLGLMAEAGPEAVMPLRRNRAGQLGVLVAGQGNGVQASAQARMPNIHIINAGPPLQVTEARMTDGEIMLRIAQASRDTHDQAVKSVTGQMGDANTKLRGTMASSVQAPRIAR